MKLVSISNNFGETYDGIGAYAKVMVDNLPSDVKAAVYSAKCGSNSAKVLRFFNLGMTKTIFRAARNMDQDDADVFLLEYPFMEWNPLALVSIWLLSRKAKKKKRLFCTSLHEYGRVKRIRKMVIKCICKMSDMLLVTNEEMQEDIRPYTNNNIHIRELPSNIWDEGTLYAGISRSRNRFVYFGLVNKVKAFYELLDAWNRLFDENGNKLYILTGSPVGNEVKKHKNVEFIYNAGDEVICRVMRECAFCFLPIKPHIDFKNATFKTATLTGCICVGKFCDEIKNMPFVLQMDDYSMESFTKVRNAISQMSNEEIKEKTLASSSYGSQFSPAETVRKMIETIKGQL